MLTVLILLVIEYPDEPKNLTIYFIDQTSVKMRWNKISNSDAEFKFSCFKCTPRTTNQTQCINKQPCQVLIKYFSLQENLTQSEIYVSSLESNTQYLIELYVQVDKGLFRTKSNQILFNTLSYKNDVSSSETLNLTALIMPTEIAISFIIILVIIVFLIWSKRNKLNFLRKNSNKNNYNSSVDTRSCDSNGSSALLSTIASIKTYIDPHTYEDPNLLIGLFTTELSPSNIKIESVIGSGEFGDVCKGRLFENAVAIKTLKDASTEQIRCDFLTQATIMAQFKHENVIKLKGIVTLSHPLMIVTEYMENGSLDSFLKLSKNKLTIHQMIKMLSDTASGMKYLSDMHFVHRDLAARNILIDYNLTCKVSDFGLSRELNKDSLDYTTKGGKIPIRWTAPEAINFRKYSHASDVWSYGVLAYEILSYGEHPYWNWKNADVIKAINKSYRLPPPLFTPNCLYELMLRCWNDNSLLRPRFHDIVSYLDEIVHLPHELSKPTSIKELMPINLYHPTQIQLTSTRSFLQRIRLEYYLNVFQENNLLNLANLFQLNNKDLENKLNIKNEYNQSIIINELKQISSSFISSILNEFNNYIFNNDLNLSSNHFDNKQLNVILV